MKHHVAIVALLTLGCARSLIVGQDAAGSEPEGSLASRLAALGVECAGHWWPSASTDLFYAVRRVGRGENSVSELVVWATGESASSPLYSVAMPLQMPVACAPIQGSGDLMTVWSTGTASVSVVVLSYDSGQVRQVLSDGSDLFPEVVIGSSGEPYIFFTYLEWRVTPDGHRARFPSEAAVYRWNGKGYDGLGRIAFARRLEMLDTPRTRKPGQP